VLVNIVVNDVAATVLEGAEIGALGLPIPTIACSTAAGVSVIHPNGDVYDQTYTLFSNNSSRHVRWNDNGGLFFGSRTSSSGDVYSLYLRNTLFADSSAVTDKVYHTTNTGSAEKVVLLGGSPPINTTAQMGNDFSTGSSGGLSIVKHNDGNPDEGAVAYVTSTYNTGYMLGDIRGAFLMGDRTADRSVKGNTLTLNQLSGSDTVDAEKVDGASGTADLYGYKSFSASNYLSRAYDADFDFGTGDFSIMFWCKLADTVNATETVLERAYGGNALFNIDFASGVPRFIAYNGSTFDTTTGTKDLSDNQWHQLMCFRKSSVAYIYIDGKQHVSNAMNYDLDNSQAILHIGQTTGNGNPLVNGSLSLLRISKTAPTPQQVADIYRAEAPLFRAGAKCLLQTGASATTNVQDLAYDSSTDLLTVGTGAANVASAGATIFRGLEAVDTFKGQDYGGWSTGTLTKVASNGGVSAYYRGFSTGGLVLDLPAIDVRGDINTADSKLPDDGKFHFTGVSTNATPTVIGHIPIAEDEHLYIKSVVNASKYRAKTSERASFEIDAQFVRKIGDDVNSPTELRRLSDETYSQTFDVVWERDTASNTARLKVTGVAGMRFEWSADITVQRITEKTYER
jgi:hypothetical protein